VRSIHDNILLEYRVALARKEIRFVTAFPDASGPEFTNVVFRGVEAYAFDNRSSRRWDSTAGSGRGGWTSSRERASHRAAF